MARAQGDIALIVLQIVEPVRDDHPFSQAREVMIQSRHGLPSVQRAWTVEIADQLFFFVSMLMTGSARAR